MDGTNPGPVGKRGGRRLGAGRPSLAALRLRELAAQEGKTPAQIIDELNEGYATALRTIDVALPIILEAMIEKALRGNADLQKFLASLYFKYVHQIPATHSESPGAKLKANLSLIISKAEISGTFYPPIIEGSGYTIPDNPAEPDPMGDPPRP